MVAVPLPHLPLSGGTGSTPHLLLVTVGVGGLLVLLIEGALGTGGIEKGRETGIEMERGIGIVNLVGPGSPVLLVDTGLVPVLAHVPQCLATLLHPYLQRRGKDVKKGSLSQK